MINGETMFILDKTKFGDCDFTNAKEFVEFWKQYYLEDTTKIFRSKDNILKEGLIYRVFLFHMARPNEYPIADKNIFRAFFILNNKNRNPDDANDKDYEEYTKFFFKIAKHAGISPESDISKYIRQLKDIDNALFAYGQFLESYDKI